MHGPSFALGTQPVGPAIQVPIGEPHIFHTLALLDLLLFLQQSTLHLALAFLLMHVRWVVASPVRYQCAEHELCD